MTTIKDLNNTIHAYYTINSQISAAVKNLKKIGYNTSNGKRLIIKYSHDDCQFFSAIDKNLNNIDMNNSGKLFESVMELIENYALDIKCKVTVNEVVIFENSAEAFKWLIVEKD